MTTVTHWSAIARHNHNPRFQYLTGDCMRTKPSMSPTQLSSTIKSTCQSPTGAQPRAQPCKKTQRPGLSQREVDIILNATEPLEGLARYRQQQFLFSLLSEYKANQTTTLILTKKMMVGFKHGCNSDTYLARIKMAVVAQFIKPLTSGCRNRSYELLVTQDQQEDFTTIDEALALEDLSFLSPRMQKKVRKGATQSKSDRCHQSEKHINSSVHCCPSDSPVHVANDDHQADATGSAEAANDNVGFAESHDTNVDATVTATGSDESVIYFNPYDFPRASDARNDNSNVSPNDNTTYDDDIDITHPASQGNRTNPQRRSACRRDAGRLQSKIAEALPVILPSPIDLPAEQEAKRRDHVNSPAPSTEAAPTRTLPPPCLAFLNEELEPATGWTGNEFAIWLKDQGTLPENIGPQTFNTTHGSSSPSCCDCRCLASKSGNLRECPVLDIMLCWDREATPAQRKELAQAASNRRFWSKPNE